ncbi:MAG: hypothetical protein OXC37_01910 [Bdellovibrionaceae bacterium]|nr:hypothetical protein [Pseudobdellovibrionaceae bacterium]
MFNQALKRLFLVLFPIFLFIIAVYLNDSYPPPIQNSNRLKVDEPNCPSIGISFLPKTESIQKNKLISYLLPTHSFIEKTKDLMLYFKKENISLKKIFFVFPVTLTKQEEWIISQKTLFILPTGERKQISHLTYSEINNFHESLYKDYKSLNLDLVFSTLPKKSNFIFYLLGSNREKVITNLYKIHNKVRGDLYFSSSNEKILKDLILYRSCLDSIVKNTLPSNQNCLPDLLNKTNIFQKNTNSYLKSNFKILHSFKTLVRLEMLSAFPEFFKQIEGEGIIWPDNLSPSKEILKFLKQKNKILFLEKDSPFTNQDKYWFENSQGLISYKAKLAISSIKNKKSCLIRK